MITFWHYYFIKSYVSESTIWSQVIIPTKHKAMIIKNGIKFVWVCNLGENEFSIRVSFACYTRPALI